MSNLDIRSLYNSNYSNPKFDIRVNPSMRVSMYTAMALFCR